MALTGDKLKEALKDIDNPDEFFEKLAKAITENLEVKVSENKVIVQVTGQAVGTPNTAPIKCEVK